MTMLLLLSGCGAQMALLDTTMRDSIIWPGPPEKPRIKYLWALHKVASGSGGLLGLQEPQPLEPREAETFLSPHGLCVDARGRLYVADPGARRVNVVELQTGKSSYFYELGEGSLRYPLDVAASPEGLVYVSDPELKGVFAFNEKGRYLFSFQGPFKRPTGLALDENKRLVYVVDTWAHKLYVHDYQGRRLRSIGQRGEGPGQFNYPTHVAVGPDGFIYVSDTANFRVQVFRPDGLYHHAFGLPGDEFMYFDKVKGIAVDTQGHIYVVDTAQDMVKIFDRQGRLLLFFGERGHFYGQFYGPTGIFIDGNDNIYVADTLNMRVQAFKFLGGD